MNIILGINNLQTQGTFKQSVCTQDQYTDDITCKELDNPNGSYKLYWYSGFMTLTDTTNAIQITSP